MRKVCIQTKFLKSNPESLMRKRKKIYTLKIALSLRRKLTISTGTKKNRRKSKIRE